MHAVYDYIMQNLPKTVREHKESEDTLIGLPHPDTVPCIGDTFQELYYWDTYFINVGLLAVGQTALAKHNVDNMLYLVDTYGFMPNGSRTFYLNRSQPPFLWAMVRDVYEQTHDTAWLANAYGALCREYRFWQERRATDNGLNAYTGYAVTAEEAAWLYEYFTKRTGYTVAHPTDEDKIDVAKAAFAMFESGWDCTSRFCEDAHRINGADLNALLFGMETAMADFASVLQNGDEATWQSRADIRKQRMNAILWDNENGMFADYNHRTGAFAAYRSAAAFYPLFCGAASDEQAAATVRTLPRFVRKFGVSAGDEHSPWHCQWDDPHVWAPLQYIVYEGLVRYGYLAEASRVADTYCKLIEAAFDETGHLWEKYDGNTGKPAVSEYDAPPMLGWTAGVYLYFCKEHKKA